MDFLEKIKEELRPRRNLVEVFGEIKTRLKKYFPKERIELYGSVAKGTHLKDASDLDIFVFFPPETPKEVMGKRVIEACKREFDTIVKYAEHPYAHITYKDVEADVVPGYSVKSASEARSAVDRTPFHYEFVVKHLTENQKDEVRLLKKFLKTAGIYGAEIKTQGFSGYVCELLIIKFGDFLSVLKEVARWKKQTVLWFEKPSYNVRERFGNVPLIFIDPVDERRNAAAAVSRESYDRFILFARAFLRNPGREFFTLGRRVGFDVVGITFQHTSKTEEIIYGQMKRYLRALINHLENKDIPIVRKFVFANEEKALI
jgi:tRNA nucleotidyltransferase (CCA-adding enzyme)